MLLCVDIGNTNITLGVFEKETLIDTLRVVSDKNLNQEKYANLLSDAIKKYLISKCIITSVVDELSETVKNAIDNIFNINSILLNNKLNLGINLQIQNPENVGMDRVVNACGAYYLYSKQTAIVVDIGTATTFDIVNKNGDFVGGIIMPGLNLQLNSLHACTSKLPEIKVNEINNAIGDNTTDAILSGVIRGTACAIEGLISQCEQELKEKAIIIATGGFSTFINKYMNRKFDYVNPSLTLEGLKLLYELNK